MGASPAGLREPLLLGGENGRRSSTLASAVVLFKSVVGTGLFALPPAIRSAGWALGSAVMLLLAAVTVYTLQIIILGVREVRRRRAVGGSPSHRLRIEFQDLTAATFTPAQNALIVSVCVLGQLGSVIGYWAFATDSVISLFPAVERWQTTLGMALFLAPLALLRTTSHPIFQAAMVFGNCAVLVAVATVLLDGSLHGGVRPLARAADGSGLGVIFGVSVFMFTGYMEVVTIEGDMARRSEYARMLNATFGAIICLYALFGALVYSFYGEATGRVWAAEPKPGHWADATIMRNLSPGFVTDAVKLAFSANLVLMTPITLLPASKAMEDGIGVSSAPMAARCAARLALVAAMGGAALLLDNFETITAAVGCLTGITAFSVPALCYLRLCGEGCGPAHRAWLGFVVGLGAFGTLFSLGQLLLPADFGASAE